MKLVHEVLEETRKKRAKADKIKVLKDNETWALKDILLGSTDTTIAFNLPEGPPPYTPNRPESAPTNLQKRNKKTQRLQNTSKYNLLQLTMSRPLIRRWLK